MLVTIAWEYGQTLGSLSSGYAPGVMKLRMKQCLSMQNFTSLFHKLTYQLNAATKQPIEISKTCEDETNHSQYRFHTISKILETG
jgi:hypothetical protein